MNNDLVWYACYGSNVYSERFKYYILGGEFWESKRRIGRCADPTLWRDSRVMRVPGRMHFAKNLSGWGPFGVAFFRPEEEGTTIMKLYLITEEQFQHVKNEEGPGENWYGHEVSLGELEGIPVRTLTSRSLAHPFNLPSAAYIDTIMAGLVLECGLSEKEAEEYLQECQKPIREDDDRQVRSLRDNAADYYFKKS